MSLPKEYQKILEITDGAPIELSDELSALLNKELCLGMTRHVCRYGTLGDGFEKYTPAQKYYQAVKECYVRSCELRRMRAQAKELAADLIDAQSHMDALGDMAAVQFKLRAESKLERAQLDLSSCLVNIQDTLRQFDEFKKVALELRDTVRAQYPEGIEQAEVDNWKTVMVSRIGLQKGVEELKSIPLDFETKYLIGRETGRLDITMPIQLLEPERASRELAPPKKAPLTLVENPNTDGQ